MNRQYANGKEGVGRLEQPAHRDISHVDQQEGAMNNGELGANLNEERAKGEEKEQQDKQEQ